MNPYVERLQKVIAFIAAFLFIVCLLLSSFEWAVYKDEDYKFYEKEYEKYLHPLPFLFPLRYSVYTHAACHALCDHASGCGNRGYGGEPGG